jgi:ESX secretion-associated protein EspJ
MGIGDGALPPLKVDPELLERYGNQLLTAAGGLPEAPPPFTVTGTDPMSQAIADKLPAMEGAIQDELPKLKQQALDTASKIVSAAGQYQRTDDQLAAQYEKHQFDSAGAPGGRGGAGGGQAMGQMSQMMGVPMQMAGHAAQLPMQAMGAVASVPQGIIQGVQQIGQMAGGLGGSEARSDKQHEHGTKNPDDRHGEDRAPKNDKQGAASGASQADQAPEPAPNDGSTTVPAPQSRSPRHAVPDPEVTL